MIDASLLVGEDVVLQPSRYPAQKSFSLHKVFSLLAAGWTSKKIRKEYPEILPETITTARATLITRNQEFFGGPEAPPKPFHDFKVLIDENITPDVAGYLRLHFKKVVHVEDVGLVGRKDDYIWEWALNNSYDVLFTKDCANDDEMDLTHIAIQDAKSIIRAMDARRNTNITLSALPVLVHLPGTTDIEAELKKLLRKHKDEFFHYLDNRATPYLDVRNGNIVCGPTYFELRGENHVKELGITEADMGRQKDDEFERYKYMWLSRLSVDEIRNMTPQREDRVDEKIRAFVGMGARPPQLEMLG
jgi:predicted nuclease of predicted toxin-antitoxin system